MHALLFLEVAPHALVFLVFLEVLLGTISKQEE